MRTYEQLKRSAFNAMSQNIDTLITVENNRCVLRLFAIKKCNFNCKFFRASDAVDDIVSPLCTHAIDTYCAM